MKKLSISLTVLIFSSVYATNSPKKQSVGSPTGSEGSSVGVSPGKIKLNMMTHLGHPSSEAQADIQKTRQKQAFADVKMVQQTFERSKKKVDQQEQAAVIVTGQFPMGSLNPSLESVRPMLQTGDRIPISKDEQVETQEDVPNAVKNLRGAFDDIVMKKSPQLGVGVPSGTIDFLSDSSQSLSDSENSPVQSTSDDQLCVSQSIRGNTVSIGKNVKLLGGFVVALLAYKYYLKYYLSRQAAQKSLRLSEKSSQAR